MKNLLAISLVFLVSCAQSQVKVEPQLSGLEAQLTPEELKIHRCLHSQEKLTQELKRSCLAGTAYEKYSGRLPSNDEDDIILKNNWFFGDNSKLDQFYAISQKFVRASARMAKHAVNDRGIAVEGAAFFGFGGGWLAEFINHHGEFGLFCAPFVTAKTDVGIEGSVAVLQSVSCSSNQAYQGGFLNLSAGVSGEVIGLPFGLSMSYSFGLDLPSFASRIRQARAQRQLSASQLAKEVRTLANGSLRRSAGSSNLAMLNIALRPLGVMGVSVPSLSTAAQMNQIARRVLREHKSLGVQFKSYYRSSLSRYLVANDLHQLNRFLSILTSTMTGCDSMGGAASLEFTASPVSVGVAYENYHLLFEMPFEDLRAFKVLSPFLLLNPFMMQAEDLRATLRVARGVLAIPGKVNQQCGQLFPRI